MNIPETELLIKLKTGDKKAFEILFNQYFNALCHFGYNYVKSIEIAEDIVEDLFFRLWENRETLLLTISIKSYLYKSVHNQCLDFLKAEKVRENYKKSYSKGLLDVQKSLACQNSNDQLFGDELQVKIQTAIDSLPEQCRRIFMMSRFDELKYSEIAEKLGLSVNTIEKQMSRALHKLREALKEYLPILIIILFFSAAIILRN
jgi:RNA polymerase sigma-70 factor (ECF subfamily)